MRYLGQFTRFDFAAFAADKVFMATGQRPWADRDTGAKLGTIVDAVIFKDATTYKRKEGDTSTNQFEKLAFKVPKEIVIPAESEIRPVNPVATVYGDYRERLSVKADSVEVVQRQAAPSAPAHRTP